MAAKLNIVRTRAAPAAVVGLLLAMTCLLLAATVANASRPLKVSSSSEGDGPEHTEVVESPAVGVGYIQTVVVGTAEQHGGAAGHIRSMSVDMLGGIKSGPSPGDGH